MPPYAITNIYSNSDRFLKRGGFQFLSGTVSYVLRTVYNFFFGITYTYDGLLLKPCIPSAFGDCQAEFTYLGKDFEIEYKKSQDGKQMVMFNDENWDFKVDDSGKMVAFFPDENLKDNNKIVVVY